MKKMICPHCDTINRPGARFCRKCGFNLAKYKQHQEILNEDNSHLKRQSSPTQHLTPYLTNPYNHHHFRKIIDAAMLALIVFIVGFHVYNQHEEQITDNNEKSQASQPIQQPSQNNNNSEAPNPNTNNSNDNQSTHYDSLNYNKSVIRTFWSNINNILNTEHNSSDAENDGNNYRDDIQYRGISKFFKDDTNNSSYKGIKDWMKFVKNADSTNDTRPITIKPYDIESEGNGNIHYKVYYDFKLKSGTHHIQIFNWNAIIKFNKIVKMDSQHKPIKDYKE